MKLCRRLVPIPVFLVVLPLLLASCTSWHRTRALSDPAAREKRNFEFRVSLVDGRMFVLHDPWFGGDTLYGRSPSRDRVSKAKYDSAIPLEQITMLEARRFDGPKTVLLVVGVGATVGLVALTIAVAVYEPTTVGSCPLIYSWDGEAWRLDSATYAGAIMPALVRTDRDNLDYAQARDGIVRLRLTGESGETEHVDAVRLLAVDHDPACTIAPDAAGTLHSLGPLRKPTAARDFRRRDALRLVDANDALSWEAVPTGRDTARAEDIRDGLEVEFPRVAGATEARLVVDGCYTAWADYLMSEYVELHGRDTESWYLALAADKAQAREFAGAIAREVFLDVSLWDGASWRRQGFVPGAGPGLSKRQVVRLDLSGVRDETVRVRLEAAPLLWRIDRVAIDFEPERAFVTKEIGPSGARDSRGRDVRQELDRADGQAHVMEAHDSVELRFAVDPTPRGRARSYLAATTGWYRMHTPESADPDSALAERLIREPRAMSRLSVARLNDALQSMETASH